MVIPWYIVEMFVFVSKVTSRNLKWRKEEGSVWKDEENLNSSQSIFEPFSAESSKREDALWQSLVLAVPLEDLVLVVSHCFTVLFILFYVQVCTWGDTGHLPSSLLTFTNTYTRTHTEVCGSGVCMECTAVQTLLVFYRKSEAELLFRSVFESASLIGHLSVVKVTQVLLN